MTTAAPKPLRIFCSYSHKDEEYVNELRTWLRGLERRRLIEWWHDREIAPGWEWEEAIDKNLRSADIIFLLITPDFIASDYVFEKEIDRAIERHERGETRVIPIIVRPADWQWAPLDRLQALPKDAKPITTWLNRDEAWLDVARGIRKAVEELSVERQERSAKEQYHKAVEAIWAEGKVSDAEAEKLGALASELDLSADTATYIEQQVMGDTIEAILARQEEAAREEDRNRRLEELYTQARRLHRDRMWQAVIDVFEQIRAEGPNYPDPEGLLVSARESIEAQEHTQQVAALYADGQRHMDSGEWQQALERLEEAQRLEPGYRDTDQLLSQVRQELAPPSTVEVPDLAGQEVSRATSTLANKGLELGAQTKVSSHTVTKGQIIKQSPEAGTEIEAGSSVSVTVSSGPSTVEVPDLTGKNRSEARKMLHSANLALGMIASAPSEDMPKGRIIEQSPVGGRKVERGGTVRITVSSRPQEATTSDRSDQGSASITQTSSSHASDRSDEDWNPVIIIAVIGAIIIVIALIVIVANIPSY